jgi:hypothetical protein
LQLGLGHPWVEAWLKKQIGKGCRGLHNPNSIKKKGKEKRRSKQPAICISDNFELALANKTSQHRTTEESQNMRTAHMFNNPKTPLPKGTQPPSPPR